MIILLTIIHIIVCVFLVIVVLLQSGKAADLAGAFGGMGSQTAFGPRGAATVLSKATTVAAGVFMLTSLSLAILATKNAGKGSVSTVLDKAASQPKPAAPAPAAGQPAAPAGQSTVPTEVKIGEGPVQPGQPSVTLTPEGGGPSKTLPVELTPMPAEPAKPPAKK